MVARPRSRLFLALVALVLVVVAPIAASAIAVWRAAHTDDASRVSRAAAILVLGAAQYGGVPSPVFEGRLDHGALLYRQGFSDTVIVLGARREGDVLSEAEAGVRYLAERGVDDEDLVPSPRGGTTYESLRAASRLMNEMGIDSAFLVSDPWHNLRIKRMARDLGIEGYASATWHSAARSQGTRLQGYGRETFAYLYYRVFGR